MSSSNLILCEPAVVGLLLLHRLRDLGPLGADGDHQQRAGLAHQPADQASPQALQRIKLILIAKKSSSFEQVSIGVAGSRADH